jgi:hypothetical protein
MLRTSAVFAAIALTCSPAVASGAQDAVQRYFAAAAQVSELLSRPDLESLPRAKDPQMAAAFAIITDVKAVLKPRRFTVNDLGVLSDVCSKNLEIMMKYALFDPKRKVDPKSNELTGFLQMMAFMNENVRAYQDEIAPLLAFSLRCPAVLIPLLGTFIARLPPEDFNETRRRGLEKMRISYLTSYLTGLRCFTRDSSAPFAPANARRVIDALVDTAPVYAGFLPLDARARILAAASQARAATPKAAPAIDKIVRAMARRDCVGLCAR